ncbi:hypothetical protein EV182_000038 [Spiromyces aspiralis]|uniref:Uncharacterized protein n=1 Tax=Spiromyces aspiralis TaxID=68401 RepID=A0ACC1HKZ2_9FUNG|nr:hypothetical protein EV182_000038 [Spiromyces aspiralis]
MNAQQQISSSNDSLLFSTPKHAGRALQTLGGATPQLQSPFHHTQHMKRNQLLIELNYLRSRRHCPSRMYIMPSMSTLNVFPRSGYWKGGVFRFRINIPLEYPNVRPSVHMLTNLFHPLVDPNSGEFTIRHQFPQWRPNRDYVFHILHYIKNSFKPACLAALALDLTADNCPNPAALELYKSDIKLFEEYASRSSKYSVDPKTLYCNLGPDCTIVFNRLGENEFGTRQPTFSRQ